MENDNGFERYGRGERFRQEDRQRSSQSYGQKKNKNRNDGLLRLLVLQSVIVAAALLAVFVMGRVSPTSGEQFKAQYKTAMKRDMTLGEVFASIKDYAIFVFNPSGENAQSGEAASEAESAQAANEDEAESSVTYRVSAFEAVSDDTGETVAVGEITTAEASGGEDMADEEAASGTSFSQYKVTAKPVNPVSGTRITSGFGYRVNPISGNYGFHTGIDLAAPEGEPISAVFFGEVIETGEDDKWGKFVRVRHSDTLETYYCHCSEILVEEGVIVRRGETLARVGSTGWSTGPHLHFEVIIEGVRVDPSILLFAKRSS